MSKKKLQKQIERKLEILQGLLKNISDATAIDPTDPETWDSDTLYDLAANLKDALKLLENQHHWKASQQLDEYGEPIILEEGLCSLVDDYHSEDEEETNDF